jgi:hypothetical protein
MTAEHDTLLKHLRGVQHIVINDCHGGFGLSATAIERYHDIMNRPVWIETNRMCSLVKTVWLVPLDQRVELPGPKEWQTMTDQEKLNYNDRYNNQVWSDRDLVRDDPVLIQVVRELGTKANAPVAKLKIVEIPASVEWQIEEYDGKEWVAERHRTWD